MFAARAIQRLLFSVVKNLLARANEQDYERRYTFTLSKGDQIGIKVSTRSQLVDLMITQGSSSELLLDEEGLGFSNIGRTVPEDGSYIFALIAETGTVDATMTITEK